MAFANLEHAIDYTLTPWTERHPGKELQLWVDQICINQNDHEERAHQISIMRDIYRRYDETFVSLSTPGSNGVLAWARNPSPISTLSSPAIRLGRWVREDCLRPVSNEAQHCSCRKASPDDKLQQGNRDFLQSSNSKTKTQKAEAEKSNQGSKSAHSNKFARSKKRSPGNEYPSIERHLLKLFMTCRWWERSWAFQELISPKPIFISHSTSVAWEDIEAALTFLSISEFTKMLRETLAEAEARNMASKEQALLK
ncbi:hypothetical protein B0H63DRAFT_122410 [Podospora didyma]|uniref:Heterokaryon incompatibility domain-containing protein n=1 Tax=Podospora didyma TaxID=330526 RepID=A0AAE0U4Q1_9PEZI|nr:hypothetical protein B0H63DRAFT_122410 [Podospora didyma]